jgi:hypothetical protein
LAQKNVKERLAQTLLYLEEKFGVLGDQSLRLRLSREEIASIIGTATESCIRLLSEFKKLGLIELNGKFSMIIRSCYIFLASSQKTSISASVISDNDFPNSSALLSKY